MSSAVIPALPSPTLPPPAQLLLTRPSAVSALQKTLRSKTISQRFQLSAKKQIYNLIFLLSGCLNQLFCKI